jgi:hypothetical protein
MGNNNRASIYGERREDFRYFSEPHLRLNTRDKIGAVTAVKNLLYMFATKTQNVAHEPAEKMFQAEILPILQEGLSIERPRQLAPHGYDAIPVVVR